MICLKMYTGINRKIILTMRFKILALSLCLVFGGLALFLLLFAPPQPRDVSRPASAATTFSTGLLGAFSAGDKPTIAAVVGLNAILDYGYNPVIGDSKSTALKAAHLNIID